jgi:hypothetical protein
MATENKPSTIKDMFEDMYLRTHEATDDEIIKNKMSELEELAKGFKSDVADMSNNAIVDYGPLVLLDEANMIVNSLVGD